MIRDTNLNALLSASFAVSSGQQVFARVVIDCEAGYSLRANPTDVTVEARFTGDVAWTNIQNAPIDTGVHAGEQKEVQFRCTAPEIGSIGQSYDVRIALGPNAAPDPVLNFAAVAGSTPGTVNESWSLPADTTNLAGFVIRLNSVAMGIVDSDATVAPTQDENLEIGLTSGADATFQIRAVNQSGLYSDWSSPVTAIVP